MIKACYVMRADLPMTHVKFAIQIGHGTDLVHLRGRANPWYDAWLTAATRRKAVLRAKTEADLAKIAAACAAAGIAADPIVDEGYTEFGRRTTTGLVIHPTEEERLPKAVRRLRLMKDADLPAPPALHLESQTEENA